MKTKLVVSVALSVCAGLVQAQSAAGRPFHVVVGMGLTGGGDTLGTYEYTDGSTSKLRAGGLVHLVAGVEYRFPQNVSLQANIGYHADSVNADNLDVTFSRVPVEFLGYYHLNQTWRLGGGLRFATSAKEKASGDFNYSLRYKSSTGLVLEGEYLFSPHVGVKLRVVSEKYELKDYNGPTIDGTHVGGYLTGYF